MVDFSTEYERRKNYGGSFGGCVDIPCYIDKLDMCSASLGAARQLNNH